MSATKRMTVSQALIEFLAHQWTVDGDIRERTIPGMFGIFGHGNVAGIGQALKQFNVDQPDLMPYYQARNEQAMVHQSVGFARMHRRRATFASAASVGPGATNMLTGAALATTNRLPALLLPSDTFATRVADPVLQQLEQPWDIGLTVNDAFRPLSRFFDRVQRPEQLYSIALAAMRVLTDPAETGAVTIALPEDVQAEAIDVPIAFLQDREWHIRRPLPERAALARAVAAIRRAKTPFIVAGGGVLYSSAETQLRELVEATGIPVGTSQAGGGVLDWDHPQNLGGVGATGTLAANRLAAEADVIIGIGTRYSDFTTASRTAFQNPDVVFVNINVASFDAYKHGSQLAVIADAREALAELSIELEGFGVSAEYAEQIAREKAAWDATVDAAFEPSGLALPGQTEIIGAVQSASDPRGRHRAGCRIPARRPAQAVARARPARLPRRVRLLVHGLRDRRRPRREARRARGRLRPRRHRHGRRRLVPHAQLRARHRGRRGHQAHRRADPEPRLRLDRPPLRDGRVRAIRHEVPHLRRRGAQLPG